jgi:hypothetical protein
MERVGRVPSGPGRGGLGDNVAVVVRFVRDLALAVVIGCLVGLTVSLTANGRAWLWLGLASGLVVWALMVEPLRRRRPTMHAGRRGDYASLWIEPPARPFVRKRHLRERAESLAGSINDLAAEGMAYRLPAWQSAGWQHADESERTRLWNENTNALIADSQAVMARFDREHGSEALVLYDEFARLGKTGGVERFRFEYPTNSLGLREVAQWLGVWAKQL